MKRTLAIAAAAFWLLAAPAQAGGVYGTVAQKAGPGTYRVTFDASLQVQPRDVFDLVRDGKTVGQAMLLAMKGEGYVVVGLQSASPQPGDQLVFVQHDAVPVTAATGPSPAPDAPTVTVTGAKTPEWMQPGYFMYGGGDWGYSYPDYNTSYGVTPFGADVFATGGLHYPGVYGGRTYGVYSGGIGGVHYGGFAGGHYGGFAGGRR